MIQTIPLTPVPSQSFNIALNNQACSINLYDKGGLLFIDLYVNDAIVVGGTLCCNRKRIVRDAYLGFIGDLSFIDNQGSSDPAYADLGTRFDLYYFT